MIVMIATGEDVIVEKRLQYAAGKVSSISLVNFKSQMKVLAETHHNELENISHSAMRSVSR